MNKAERKQAIALQDAIGELIDRNLIEGMDVETIKTILLDESEHLAIRKEELEIGLR